jgi:hypothetical protein
MTEGTGKELKILQIISRGTSRSQRSDDLLGFWQVPEMQTGLKQNVGQAPAPALKGASLG